jgi:glycerol-3-phosphate dehydrogenase
MWMPAWANCHVAKIHNKTGIAGAIRAKIAVMNTSLNENETLDALIVGGGVNGTGIARDLAGRGLRVALVEKDDLAAHTSSASTKLIHGGLRYLEHYEFGLVRKALIEREVLLRNAPHIMWPLRFVMPHHPSMRPLWFMRLGVFLYDHLAKREILPGSQALSLRKHAVGAPLKSEFVKALVYSDGWVDDARLTVLNAVDAAERGATILTRTACTHAETHDGQWRITIKRGETAPQVLRAKTLINAAGPWAEQFVRGIANTKASKSLRLVRGSHIVVKKLFDHDHAYIFQNPDNRIVFAIPYEDHFTLVGTTDIEEKGDAQHVKISEDETGYLLALINRYFEKPVTQADVVWSYSGVRPLIDDASGDPSKVTRDYELEWLTAPAPLMNIWGGKITTFRKLSEEVADQVATLFPNAKPAWTANAPLPGGDLSGIVGATRGPVADFVAFVAHLERRFPKTAPQVLHRLARAYGARALEILNAPQGAEIAPQVFEAELDYLRRKEWAQTGEDVLRRRSKLILHLNAGQQAAVSKAMGG